MESEENKHNLTLENVWRKDISTLAVEVLNVWKSHGGPMGEQADKRLQQLAFVVKNNEGRIVGISTAFKVYFKQLRNYFFAIRLMVIPDYRIPGLASKLIVSTRDFLESIHGEESSNPAIGIITLVENPDLKEKRNEAVWPASGMVYIGHSKEGHHIRVYYFRGARIVP